MSSTETKCPRCKATLKNHPTLIGFDVVFYRCYNCKKNWSESSGNCLDQLGDFLLSKKVELKEVDESGRRL